MRSRCAILHRAVLSPLPAAVLAILAAMLLAGCATPQSKRPEIDQARVADEVQKQQEFVTRQFLRKHNRVLKVAWPVLKANAPLCEKAQFGFGLYSDTTYTVPKALRSGYASVLGVSERLTVVDVIEGTPAHKAGILPGDVIVGVGDEMLPEGNKAHTCYLDLLKKHIAENGTVTLRVERNNSPLQFTVEGERVCGYPVLFKDDQVPNAYATGEYIVVQSGLLNIVDSDDELAQIVSHELAHNACGHIKAKQTNQMGGLILGGLLTILTGVDLTQSFAEIGAEAYSQSFEYEADYVGVYYTARAGYDITYLPDTWRKFSTMAPQAITTGSTHPPNADRYVALEATIKEIRTKQAAGQELLPEFKGKTATSDETPKDATAETGKPAGQ